MPNSSLEQQEKRYDGRRKRLRRLLAAILVATLIVVAVGLWASLRRGRTVVNAPVSLPENVSRRQSGIQFTRSEAGRQIFTVRAARTYAYGASGTTGEGNMLLEDVHVVIYGQAGSRQDEMTTDRCRYDAASGGLSCSGKASIRLETSMPPGPRRPFFIETSDVSYEARHSAVTTPKPVRFQFGLASGAATGLSYNTRTQSMSLESDVSLRLPGVDGGTIDASAGSLNYSKQNNQVALAAPVRVSQGNRWVHAAAGRVFLDSANRITRIALSGFSAADALPGRRLTGAGGVLEIDLIPGAREVRMITASGRVDAASDDASGMRRLKADSAALTMTGPKSIPQSGRAQGHVELSFVGKPSAPAGTAKPTSAGERVLTANDLRFRFAPGGLPREAHTQGPGKLVLVPGTGGRTTVTAGSFRMTFNTAGRLTALRGLASARIVDQPASSRGSIGTPAVSTSNDLLASVNPATGALKTVRQSGNVTLEQGGSHGRASEATFNAQKQTALLAGNPELWNSDLRARADQIRMDLMSGIANGEGHVQSVYLGGQSAGLFSGRPGADAHPSGTRREEGAGNASVAPVMVLADKVTVYRDREYAHYEGHVRAVRGADVVESESLDIFQKAQRLSTGRGVTTWLIEPAFRGVGDSGRSRAAKAARSAASAVEPVTITANRLDYFNPGKAAVYEGNVRMTVGAAVFTSDRLEVYFSSAGNQNPTGPHKAINDSINKPMEIERVVADGHVMVKQPPGRRASGEHAKYFANTGKIVLTGGHPAVYDPQQGYLTAQTLTFSTRDGSLFAGGGKNSKTHSMRHILQQ